MHLGGANYVIARWWRRRGALAFEVGDVADDNLTDKHCYGGKNLQLG